MTKSFLKILGAAALLSMTSSVVFAQASVFPVCLKRTGSNACDSTDTTATSMSIEPSGQVTLEGVEGLSTGLPGGATGLGNITLTVTPPNPAASGDTVVATVGSIPAGASCTMRTITTVSGGGSIGGQGWTDGGTLCTSCASTVDRSLTLNASTGGWELKLNAQCSILTGDGYAVSGPIKSSDLITVPPAVVAPGDCPYGDNVPTDHHDGLTIASRQTQVNVTANGFGGPGLKDGTVFTSLFSAHPGGLVGGRTLPSAGLTGEGYGYPGSHANNFTWLMQTGKFVALKFRVPSSVEWKGVSSWVLPFSPQGGNSTPVSWSIAPCAGQFRSSDLASLPPTCFNNTQSTESGGVKTIVSDPSNPYTGSGACPIEMGKTYYFNIMATNPAVPGNLNPANATQNSWCPNSVSCSVRMGRAPLSLDTTYN